VNALAHPARRQILMAIHLRREPVSAGALNARFSHSWPTTTRHLRVLEQAGLLSQQKSGRTRLYSVNTDRLALLGEWMAWFFKEESAG